MPLAPARVLAALLLVSLPPLAPAGVVRPSAVAVPLPLPCDMSQSSNSHRLATDASGALWLAAHCSGHLVVTVSLDGGATWSPPVVAWPAGVLQASLEGGTLPGHALLAWETFTGQVLAATSGDWGATWSAPSVVIGGLSSSTSGGMSVVAEADRYHVMSWSAFRNRAVVVTSPDRGASWNPEVEVAMPWAYGDLVHDVATDALELVSDSPSFFRRGSADHGATFTPAAPLPGGCCLTGSDWALGGSRLLVGVGSGSVLWQIDLAAATAVQVPGLPDAAATQRAVDADASGMAHVVTRMSAAPSVLLHRVPPGAASAGAAILLDTAGTFPHVIACETGSSAAAWLSSDGVVHFDKECADGTASCCVAETNLAPACAAGGPYLASCAGAATEVRLDGTGSTDPEGAGLIFAWSTDCPGGRFDDAAAPEPLLRLDPGGACDLACGVTLSVSDGATSSACSATVQVVDDAPPRVERSGSAIVRLLWPPNHRMARVDAATFAPRVLDACDAAPSWILVGCVSDQPDDARGDGATAGDCVVADDGAGVLVRAERDGARAQGRTYSALAVAIDACGHASAATVIGTIHVPRDQSPRARP